MQNNTNTIATANTEVQGEVQTFRCVWPDGQIVAVQARTQTEAMRVAKEWWLAQR